MSFLDNQHPALLNAVRLGIFAIIAAFILGATYSSTAERIAASQLAVEQRALLEVVATLDDKTVDLTDRLVIPAEAIESLNLDEGQSIQVVRNSRGEATAFIVPATAPDGYSGAIRLLVGIDQGSNITGVRAIEHAETPGLGDKVDIKKSDWINGFIGKSLSNPTNGWAVKKDGGSFDAFTGATITPRAVVSQVEAALKFYAQYQTVLVEQSAQINLAPDIEQSEQSDE
jgi:Na+-translocating ferredoxin:NAD+ oxidoreductase subunit G